MDESVRAALYARVSSQRQAKEMTVGSQLDVLRERMRDDGVPVAEELCFVDDGFSGSILVRPELERLRDMAHAGGIDRLYVLAPDRLARRYVHQVLLLDELTQHGVEVIFLNDAGRQDGPEYELLRQVQGVIAEYERAKILERTRRGRRHAARRGAVSVLTRAPFGYRYLSKHEGGGAAAYVVVEEEAAVVRDLFRWVGVEGLSLSAAARRLSAAGVRTRTGQKTWDRTTISGMLNNSAYKGAAAWGKTRGQPRRSVHRAWRGQPEHPRREQGVYPTLATEHEIIPVPALVSAELFAAATEQLEHNRRRRREQCPGSRFLLQGLLVCQRCGSAYCGRRPRRGPGHPARYTYYRCLGTDPFRFAGAAICDNASLNGARVEEAVWADVRSLLQEPDRLRQEFERRQERGAAAPEVPAEGQARLAQLKRRIARLIDAYEHGHLDKSEFEPRIRAAKESLAREEEQQARRAEAHAEAEQLRLLIADFGAFTEGMRAALDEANEEAKRRILHLLVKRIEVGNDVIRIVYKVHPRPFDHPPAGGMLQHCGGGRSEAPAN